ncbi:MAG: hypothetical protein ACR2L3_02775 [Actinomycetota bacterium]
MKLNLIKLDKEGLPVFVQVITAKVKDRGGVDADRQRWEKELMPGADGFLGSTGGITSDGQMVLAARFESEEAARRNNDRTEQGEFWSRMESHLDGEASFFETSHVSESSGGGSDDAGFVQVMKGKVNDIEAAERLDARMDKEMPDQRKDVLGSVTAYKDDGNFYTFIYFTSLEEARRGEKEMTENPPAVMGEWMALMDGEMTFYDLEEPWLTTK